MTWEEVRDLERSRTVAILPAGAVEAHGPHLPLGTDLVIAEAMARAGAVAIEKRGRIAVVLPALAFTPAPFAAAFPGTLSTAPATLTSLVVEVASEMSRHGFAALAVANAHLDPAHRTAISEAVRRARDARCIPIVFPDVTRKPWATRLTEEFRSGSCHAGRYEGSIVMAERPDLVRERIAAELAPNPNSLSKAMGEGASTFEQAGGPRAYFGWPAEATAEEGRRTIAVLGDVLADAVWDVVGQEGA